MKCLWSEIHEFRLLFRATQLSGRYCFRWCITFGQSTKELRDSWSKSIVAKISRHGETTPGQSHSSRQPQCPSTRKPRVNRSPAGRNMQLETLAYNSTNRKNGRRPLAPRRCSLPHAHADAPGSLHPRLPAPVASDPPGSQSRPTNSNRTRLRLCYEADIVRRSTATSLNPPRWSEPPPRLNHPKFLGTQTPPPSPTLHITTN